MGNEKIPLNSLVEFKDGANEGIRLRVFAHTKDCDGSCLYLLCIPSDAGVNGPFVHGLSGGWSYNDLTLVTVECPPALAGRLDRQRERWGENKNFNSEGMYL